MPIPKMSARSWKRMCAGSASSVSNPPLVRAGCGRGRLTDFMPEHQIAVADKLGLVILMHLSKRDAIADPANVEDLLRLSDQYPNAKWILARIALQLFILGDRGVGGQDQGLHNVWYDTSTVCDSDALDALYMGVSVDPRDVQLGRHDPGRCAQSTSLSDGPGRTCRRPITG